MLRYPLRAALLLLLLAIVPAFGGCGDLCNPLNSVTAKVMLQGNADLAVPVPVTLRGVVIGQVKEIVLDADNRPVLVLCLDKKPAGNLDKRTVFYVDKTGVGASLVCEPVQAGNSARQDDPDSKGGLVFLGFESYEDYLAWRAANMVKEGVGGFLDALDQALDSFKEQIQPGSAGKPPQ